MTSNITHSYSSSDEIISGTRDHQAIAYAGAQTKNGRSVNTFDGIRIRITLHRQNVISAKAMAWTVSYGVGAIPAMRHPLHVRATMDGFITVDWARDKKKEFQPTAVGDSSLEYVPVIPSQNYLRIPQQIWYQFYESHEWNDDIKNIKILRFEDDRMRRRRRMGGVQARWRGRRRRQFHMAGFCGHRYDDRGRTERTHQK